MGVKGKDACTAAFWSLVRAGLWGDARFIDGFGRLSDEEWRLVAAIGRRTSTAGLVVDGFAMLPAELMPSSAVKYELISEKMRLAKVHQKHNAVICSLAAMLGDAGLEPVLMKGQANAVLYRDPLSRGCGDIDVYVGVERFGDLLAHLDKLGIPTLQEVDEHNRDEQIIYEGIEVEFHRYANVLFSKKADAAYQRWWRAELDGAEPQWLWFTARGEMSAQPMPDAQKMRIIPPQANVVFLFLHALLHFIGTVVVFRQFCDLAVCLDRYAGQISEDGLRQILADIGMLDEWRVVGCLLHDSFGLDQSRIPLYDSKQSGRAARMRKRLEDKCMHPRKRKAAAEPTLGRKLATFLGFFVVMKEIAPIFPGKTLQYLRKATAGGLHQLAVNQRRR